jgi:biopolymer transport protein TolR
MGMSTAQTRAGGRHRRGVPRYKAMCEINMTPFIDVMLAAPLLATGVPIDLPHTKASALNIDQKPISVAIDEKGAVYLMDEPVPVDQLADKLKDAAHEGFDQRIYVRGANDVNYGKIAEVMSIITTAGYKKVALVTEPSKN